MSLGHRVHPRIMTSAAALIFQMARDTRRTIISEFGLLLLARQLFKDRGYAGQNLPPRNGPFSAKRARNLLADVTFTPFPDYPDIGARSGQLLRDPEFSGPIFIVEDGDAEAVLFDADPFCYLSHASALAWHGLSAPEPDLFVSTADRALWARWAREKAAELLGHELGEWVEAGSLFRMTPPRPLPVLRKRNLHRHERSDPLSPNAFGADDNRVSPVGVTFRDSIAAPGRCGGAAKVVAVWRAHALRHLDSIIAEIDLSVEKIVRVRAGYLLEEVLGVRDPRVARWVDDAQRGSSRKLDPAAAYAGRFSKRWMLSINIDDPTLPAVTA
jgi:hypothetical protein